MQAPHVLCLLRPLLARPAQLRAGGARFESSCDSRTCPPCPPCESPPQPKCRGRPNVVLTGKRVVCCPPPQGSRPPCAAQLSPCALSCENKPKTKLSLPLPTGSSCGAMDRVTERMRAQEAELRRQYEAEVEERNAAPQEAWPEVNCKLSLPESQSPEMATDGRSYSVLPGQPPAPRCPPRKSPLNAARMPPEPQLVQLKRPTCAKVSPDPCAHQPRTLMSIDRSAGPDPKCDPICDTSPKPKATTGTNIDQRSKSPEPCPLSKKLCDNRKGKGLKARILESLGRGSSASPGGGGASGHYAIGHKGPGRTINVGNKSWCDNLPEPAPAPPCCNEATVQDRLKRTPPAPCGPMGKRHLHTSATTEAAKPAADREATIAAAKKLKATLEEREKLKEAGRGRTVLPPVCEVPLPPPLKPSGGALELGVPPGADTVCVRVSVGSGGCAVPASPCARAGSPAPRLPTAPPATPPGGGTASDSWLSIKSLQQKLSGRQSCATKPAESLCGQSPASAKSKTLSHPASGNPCAQQKMADIIPKTIFIRTT